MHINMHLLSACGNFKETRVTLWPSLSALIVSTGVAGLFLKIAKPGSWLDSVEKVGSKGRWDRRTQGAIPTKVGASGAEGSGIDLSLSQHEQSGIMRALLARRERKWTRSPREPGLGREK